MELGNVGIKDIILPGEIRTIMNTVLIAEKQAQANVITRREEVASTRSLLNTAKLMEENENFIPFKRNGISGENLREGRKYLSVRRKWDSWAAGRINEGARNFIVIFASMREGNIFLFQLKSPKMFPRA